MGYVIAAIVVLLLVAGFVTFFVLNATRRANPAAPDESPLGDTTEVSEATTPEDSSGAGELPRVGDPGPEAGEQERRRAANRRA